MAEALGSVGSAFIQIVADFSKLESQLKSGVQNAAKGAAAGLKEVGDEGEKAARRTESGFARLRNTMTDFSKRRQEALEGMKSFTAMGDALQQIGSKTRSLGIGLSAAISAPILAVTGLGLSFNAMQERAQISFATMLGSGEKARVFLEDMKDFAAKTPFEFPDLVAAAQRMLAYGFAANEVLPTLRTIGDAAAMLGASPEVINRITLAFGQIKAKGTVQAEEMRQLAEAGIPAWKILGDQLGVTIPEAMKLVEQRAVSADVAITALSKGMNERFAGGMEQASKSWSGLMSTIKDEARFLAGSITAGTFDALKGPLAILATGMHDVRMVLDALPNSFKAAGVGAGILVASLGPALLIFGTLAGSASNLIGLYVQLTATSQAAGLAIGGFSVASIAATAGVIGLGAAIGIGVGMTFNWILRITELQGSFDRLLAGVVNTIPVIGKHITGANAAAAGAKNLTEAQNQLIESFKSRGIAVDASRVGDSAYLASLAAQFRQTTQSRQATDVHAKSLSSMSDVTASAASAMNKLAASFDRSGAAARKATPDIRKIIGTAAPLMPMPISTDIGLAQIAAQTKVGEIPLQRSGIPVQFPAGPTASTAQWDAEIEREKQRAKQFEDAWSHAMGEVTADFARGMTDIAFRSGSFGETIKGTFTQLGRSITQTFFTELFSPVTQMMSELGRSAAQLAKGALFGGAGGGGLLGGLFGIGTGAAKSAATGTAGSLLGGALTQPALAAPALASGVGGAASSAAGAATSSLTSTVNMISGIASALGSIAGAFGTMRLEGTMNAVEYNTRASEIHLGVMIDHFFHPWSSHFEWIRENTSVATLQLDAIYNAITGATPIATAVSAPDTATTGAPGGIVIEYHEGDITVIAPASSEEEIRKAVVTGAETNRDGFLEILIKAFRGAGPGVVTAPA